MEANLSDLKGGEVLLPPELGAAGGRVVVVVHDEVDEEVDRNDDPLDRGRALELGEAERGGGRVVEDVEEG